MSALATRIRWILEHRDLTQRQLGENAGLASSFISVFLDRAKKDPEASISTANLAAIAAAAGVSIEWLARGVGSPDAVATAPTPNNGRPHFVNIPGWDRLLAAAQVLDPAIPEWAWEELGRSNPLLTAPPTPGLLVDLARVVMKHVQPPQGATKKKRVIKPAS